LAGDGEEREALESLARELGVAERAHFLGYRDDTGDVLDALDTFVVCSNREGLSNAMLEALAAGVPVVSTPVSGSDDALSPFPDGRAPGMIVGFEAEEIAAALRDLLADRERLREMGDAARERAATSFSVDGMLDAWEAVLAGEEGRGR
ncbi:MAG TPA: glycosyltransferase, partial [Longimicrobium sp.]|nr:glycosyltransferase [Longimicrobium sp.]